MDDLMKTTMLLIESEQRNERLAKENEMLENASDYLKEDNEQLQKQVQALQNSEDWYSSYSTYISDTNKSVDTEAIKYANKGI